MSSTEQSQEVAQRTPQQMLRERDSAVSSSAPRSIAPPNVTVDRFIRRR